MSSNQKKTDEARDEVRHEYGHTIQLKQLGVKKYLLCIGIPSVCNWGTGNYYDKPWEITADYYGGVHTTRTHNSSDINNGFVYLSVSNRAGIVAWFLIK